jgi:CRP-like cAMP-binding protein
VSRVRGDRRLRLATVGSGRLLGELSLVDGGPRTATCTAAEPALVLELGREVVAKLLDHRSPVALGLLCEVNHALIAALHATEAGVEWLAPPGRPVDRRRLVERIRPP